MTAPWGEESTAGACRDPRPTPLGQAGVKSPVPRPLPRPRILHLDTDATKPTRISELQQRFPLAPLRRNLPGRTGGCSSPDGDGCGLGDSPHPQTRVSAGGGGHREGVCPFGVAAAGKWRRRGWQGLPGDRGSVGLRSWGSSGTGLVPSTRAPLPGLLSAASRGGKQAPIPRRWEGGPSSRSQAAVGARFLPGTSGKRGLQAPKLRAWGVSRAPRHGSVRSREGEEPL